MARSGRKQRQLVLDYTLDNMETIKSVFDGVDIGRYLKVFRFFFFKTNFFQQLLGIFVTQADYTRISTYFDSNPINNAERSIRQGLEDIKIQAAMLERNGEQIRLYLASK